MLQPRRPASFVLALVLSLGCGGCCSSRIRGHEHEHDPALYRGHDESPAPHAPPAAGAHDRHEGQRDHRDRHGPPQVEGYIASLESEERRRELRVELVLETLELPRDAWVGDLGSGPGVFSVAFARAVPEGLVFAADVEPRQLDRLREHATALGLTNLVPVLASYDSPFFPAGRLDLVWIADTLHHIEGRVEYLRRLVRALEPGGRVAILELKPGPLPIGPPPDHKLAEGELERTLEEAGYRLVRRMDTHPYHDFTLWAPR